MNLSPEIYSIGSVVVVSALPLLAGFILLLRARHDTFIFTLVSLSVGALFGDAFLHLIPETFRTSTSRPELWILAGIGAFFLFEKFLHWHHEHIHEHSPECEHRILPIGPLSLAADALHNGVDGMIIAASYMASFSAGIATTIAVILHEIPQELGDLGLLIHAGYSKRKALLYNFYSGITALIGALAVIVFSTNTEIVATTIVPFAAGSFIYIAGSDLIPELHKKTGKKHSALQVAAIAIGFLAMYALLFVE